MGPLIFVTKPSGGGEAVLGSRGFYLLGSGILLVVVLKSEHSVSLCYVQGVIFVSFHLLFLDALYQL